VQKSQPEDQFAILVEQVAIHRDPGVLPAIGNMVMILSGHVNRHIQDFELPGSGFYDANLEMGFGWHLGLICPTTRPAHEQAPIRSAEFNEKDICIAVMAFECGGPDRQALKAILQAAAFPQGRVIGWFEVGIPIRQRFIITAVEGVRLGKLSLVQVFEESDQRLRSGFFAGWHGRASCQQSGNDEK